jgi:acetoacetyl-CoA reductase
MKNKLALVTGGTRGIGKGVCIKLRNLGYDVIANYKSDDESAYKFSREEGINTYKWDVSDYDACQSSINKIEKDFDHNISVLVNCAGIIRDKMFHKMDFEDWDIVLKTDLYSCFNMCRLVINKMRDNQYGSIVNVSSMNSINGCIGQANYTAAKSGIIGFTRTLALENAKKGIRVNTILPGYIETEMTNQLKPEIIDKVKSSIPMGRFGTVDEIADAITFLVSDKASFITGVMLSVNGGETLI